jgi:hypothetical protein
MPKSKRLYSQTYSVEIVSVMKNARHSNRALFFCFFYLLFSQLETASHSDPYSPRLIGSKTKSSTAATFAIKR